jgi:serine/threonine protein kinase
VAETRATFDTLPVGYRLDDYRIVAVLGKGGFGITYKAMDERLERPVAVKEYLPRDYAFRGDQSVVLPRSDDEKGVFEWGLSRFVQEARALALFRHPNIISVLRYLEANGTAYLVMEYEEGEDLDHWLARRPNVTETQLVNKILLPILDGLEKVHAKQLLHRDIKPGNIFIRSDGTPVLIDFGASRAHGAQAATNVTSIVSAGYSPFEQYGGGNTKQGPWTDLYALAGTVYRVIAGRQPTDAIARMQGQPLTPAVEVGRGRYSEPVLAAIDRALSLDAKDRPQSVAEFRVLLSGVELEPTRPLIANDATVVRRGPPPGVEGKKRRRAGPLLAAFTVALLGIGAAGWYFVIGPGKPGRVVSPPESTVAESSDAPASGVTEPASDKVAQSEPPTQQTSVPETSPQENAPNVAVADSKPEEPPPAPIDPEDKILEGLEMPDDIHNFRAGHIGGTLLAYVQARLEFDKCQASQCKELPTLVQTLVKNQEGSWRKPDYCEGEACEYTGTVKVTNPRKLDRPDCPYLIDMTEVLRHAGDERKQVRTYCTENGFNRKIDNAGPVT